MQWRIMHEHFDSYTAQVDTVKGQVDTVKGQLSEVQERLEFLDRAATAAAGATSELGQVVHEQQGCQELIEERCVASCTDLVSKALAHERSARLAVETLTESCRELLEAERVGRQSDITALRQDIEAIWQSLRNEWNRREQDSMQKSMESQAINTKLDSFSRSLQTEILQRERDLPEALEGAARVHRELKPEVVRAQETADTLKADTAAWVEVTQQLCKTLSEQLSEAFHRLRADLLQLGREFDAHKARTRIDPTVTLARDGRANPAVQRGESTTWASPRRMANSCTRPTLSHTGQAGDSCNSAEAGAVQGSVVNARVMRVRTASPEHIGSRSNSVGNNTADPFVQVVINTVADMEQACQRKTLPGVNREGSYHVTPGNMQSAAWSPKPVPRMKSAGLAVPMASWRNRSVQVPPGHGTQTLYKYDLPTSVTPGHMSARSVSGVQRGNALAPQRWPSRTRSPSEVNRVGTECAQDSPCRSEAPTAPTVSTGHSSQN